MYGLKDIEYTGYTTAAIHACFTVLISFFIIFSFDQDDLLQLNINRGNDPMNYQLPFSFRLLRLLGVFQTAYFFIDAIQLFFCYTHKSVAYRFALIFLHLFSAACACCIYHVDPYIAYIYTYNCAIEFSNIFMITRYFARKWNNEFLFFIAGIGTLIFYPICRLVLTVYCSYLAYYGLFYLFMGSSGIWLVIAANAFVFLLSLYYSITIWMNPKAMYVMKRKQKQK